MSLVAPGPATALQGLTILECSHGVAAAYCGRLLAMYGARVVLVEPRDGSRLRRVPPASCDGNPAESGAPFLTLAAGKESITLDFDS
ncbi:MAG TPA: CoA transferase, partial [Tepidiformaceae bacterium]